MSLDALAVVGSGLVGQHIQVGDGDAEWLPGILRWCCVRLSNWYECSSSVG